MLAQWLRLSSLERRPDVDDRPVVLAMFGRFTDEVLHGALSALTPVFKTQLGLSLAQIGALDQVLRYVAVVVEPAAAAAMDVYHRNRILAWGAIWLGISVLIAALGNGYWALFVAFAAYGAGSGPLASTSDVVITDAHPNDAERAFARATTIDTTGALLSPLVIAGVLWLHINWRIPLALAGVGAIAYGVALARTSFPNHGSQEHADVHVIRRLLRNIRSVLSNKTARIWLAITAFEGLSEIPLVFQGVWMHDHAGLALPLVGLFIAATQAGGLIGLLLLDRLLARRDWRVLMTTALGSILVLYPAWLYVPTVGAKFATGVVLSIAWAIPWPILRSRMLVSAPERGGAATAIASLLDALPFSLLFGIVAGWVGLTTSMLVVTMVSIGAMLALTLSLRLVDDSSQSPVAEA